MAEREAARSAWPDLGGVVAALRAGASGSLGGLVLLLLALVTLFSAVIPGFASVGTLQSFMFQMPELGLLSLAMVVPLISGGLNLAIIATANQCALLMVWLMKLLLPAAASGSQTALVILAAIAAGALLCTVIGLITGVLVAYTGVHPILVTLGMKSLIDGISIDLTRGTTISGLPSGYAAAGNAVVLGVPVPFIVLTMAAILIGVLLKRTPFGVAVAMVGSNPQATRYSAIDTRRVLVGVYLVSSLLCWLAACLMLARFNSASAEYAQSYLLITILAAVLGGVDPFGGFGRVAGLILALAVLQVLSSGCNLLGFSDYLTLAIWGLTLIAVMAAQRCAIFCAGCRDLAAGCRLLARRRMHAPAETCEAATATNRIDRREPWPDFAEAIALPWRSRPPRHRLTPGFGKDSPMPSPSRTLLGLAAAGLLGASFVLPAAACEWQHSVSASAGQAAPAAPQVVARNGQAGVALRSTGCGVATATTIVDGHPVTRTIVQPGNCDTASSVASHLE